MAKIYETKEDVRRDELEKMREESIKLGDLGIFQATAGGLLAAIPFAAKNIAQQTIKKVAPNFVYEAGISTWNKVGIGAAIVMSALGVQKIISSYKQQTAVDMELDRLGPQEVEYKKAAINLAMPQTPPISPTLETPKSPVPTVQAGSEIAAERLAAPAVTSQITK